MTSVVTLSVGCNNDKALIRVFGDFNMALISAAISGRDRVPALARGGGEPGRYTPIGPVALSVVAHGGRGDFLPVQGRHDGAANGQIRGRTGCMIGT